MSSICNLSQGDFRLSSPIIESDLPIPHKHIQNFKIFHQNIRSMRKNFDFFVIHLASFISQPDIIFLTEIWIKQNEISNYHIHGYSLYCKCNENMVSGGTAVFINNTLSHSVKNIDISSADSIKCNVVLNKINFTFICIYRLHACPISMFIDQIKNILCTVNSKNLIILGDLNIDIFEKNSVDVSNYFTMMASFGLKSYVNKTTRLLSGKCIDHIFARSVNLVEYVGHVEHHHITDHSLVMLDIKIKSKKPKNKIKTNNSRTIVCYEKLNEKLYTENWSSVYNARSPSLAFNNFIDTLKMHSSNFSKQISYKSKHYKLKPWMSNRLLNKINVKKKLCKKFKNNVNNTQLLKRLDTLTKVAKQETVLAKLTYFNRIFDKKNDIKTHWKNINELTGKSLQSLDIQQIMVDNGLSSDTKVIANVMNDFFVNIGYNSSVRTATIINSNQSFVQQNFFVLPTDVIEVSNIINNLKNSYSAGFDGFSNAFVKKIAPNICGILCYIFNFSISSGSFPDLMKKAIVIPLHKKGDKKDPNNYRPISLLSVFSKILEKIIKVRMLKFLNKFSLLSELQFGFREKCSTEDALLCAMNKVYTGMNDGKTVGALFLDISKAFDLVDHDILLKYMWKYGFRGSVYDWFRSYLDKRQMCVRLKDVLSDEKYILSGVPQGSVLGPILFLIFFNSLLLCDLKGECVAFADDLAIIYSGGNREIIENDMQSDLVQIRLWFDSHRLALSPKSKCIFFDLIKPNQPSEIVYHSQDCLGESCLHDCLVLEQVNDYKYLGIIVDRRLSFKPHSDSLTTELRKTLSQFYLLRGLCPRSIIVNLYYALVYSRLQYGISCWGGSYSSNIEQIKIIQKNIIRVMCFKNPRTPSFPLFTSLSILPLRYIFIYKVLKIFFIRGGHKIRKKPSYSLRKGDTCLIPLPNNEQFRRYYLFIAPNIFNKLPILIKKIEKISNFLVEVKKWLFTQENVEYLFSAVGN